MPYDIVAWAVRLHAHCRTVGMRIPLDIIGYVRRLSPRCATDERCAHSVDGGFMNGI